MHRSTPYISESTAAAPSEDLAFLLGFPAGIVCIALFFWIIYQALWEVATWDQPASLI